MGLDMYIENKTLKEIKAYSDKKCTNKITCYVPEYEEVAYWRKSYHIHDWFERNIANNNIENCKHYPVSIEILKKLKDDCKKVLKNHNLAPELIPEETNNYNSIYFYEIEDTIDIIENIEDGIENGVKYDLYYYSWW